MNKESLMDDILKEKAKSENMKLPKYVNITIDKTLSDLPDRSKAKRGRVFKKVSIAAVIALTIITCFSVTFPAYARNIPILKSVFEFLSEKNLIEKGYVEYSSDLNLSDVSNGVKVTINGVVYDGIDLSIAYTVESEKEINIEPHIMHRTFKINGGLFNSSSSTGSGKFINKNTYVAVDTFSVSNDYIPKEVIESNFGMDEEIPDNFTLDLNIQNFSEEIWGDWNFKFKVSKDKMVGQVKEVKTSIDLSEIRDGLMVKEVVFTPISTVLRLSEDYIDLTGNRDGFIVVDDKGRSLKWIGGNGYAPSSETKGYYSQERYTSIYEDTNSVTFIPFVYKGELTEENGIEAPKYYKKEVLLNKHGNTALSQGEVGEYIVTKVEFLEDKTLIHYKCTGLIATHHAYNLSIVDSDGKEYEVKRENVREEDNQFIAEIEALSSDKEYILRASDYEKNYEVKENLKFTIDVK